MDVYGRLYMSGDDRGDGKDRTKGLLNKFVCQLNTFSFSK